MIIRTSKMWKLLKIVFIFVVIFKATDAQMIQHKLKKQFVVKGTWVSSPWPNNAQRY